MIMKDFSCLIMQFQNKENKMNDILIINTGGTFNKKYNSITGENEIVFNNIEDILNKWKAEYKIINIINKDSLDFTDKDRVFLKDTINKIKYNKIVIIHGTDTMHLSAKILKKTNKTIVFTGAMTPYNMKNSDADLNLSSAIGFLNALEKKGVFIAMNGLFGTFKEIKKDFKKGKFVLK